MASAMAYVGLPLESLLLFLLPPWQSYAAAASSRREELWLEGGWDSSSTFFLASTRLRESLRKHSAFDCTAQRPGVLALLVSHSR